MIIELKVGNFRSIRETQLFSMVANKTTKELEHNICSFNSNLSLVRSAVLYVANASGKSNLLSAILFMRWFIISSARESQQGEEIPVESFSFDDSSRSRPSEFEITFIKDDSIYSANSKIACVPAPVS